MNHRLKEVEESLKEVKKDTQKNTEAIASIEKKVEEIAEAAKTSNECMTKDEIEARLREERDEMRERNDREVNVIVHGAEECGPETSGGDERMAWEKGECLKLFSKHNAWRAKQAALLLLRQKSHENQAVSGATERRDRQHSE
jgi:hypothetical protein